jgi:putative lipoprotein
MKRNMKLITMVICALVITLFTASCSKDNNIPDAEKTAEQALNNMVGTYNGTLRTDNNTPNSVLTIVTWTANKNSTIIVNDFPYNLLANGVSKNTASPLYTTLLNAKKAPLKFYITTLLLQDDYVLFNLSPNFKFDVTVGGETYELTGVVAYRNNLFYNSYTMSRSEMAIQFTINSLVRIDKAHATATKQDDFDTPVSFSLTGRKI